MTERTSIEQRIESAKARAAVIAEQGGLGEASRNEAVREAEEIATDPALNRYINDMENRQVAAEEKERTERTRRRNLEERRFGEALERHRRGRLEFFRAQGVPEKVFDEELWSSIRASFVAGEPDMVDRERAAKSTPVF